MTLKEIFNALHDIDSNLAHGFLVLLIDQYGRQDPRTKEVFGEEVKKQ